jgi:hypothetical protein
MWPRPWGARDSGDCTGKCDLCGREVPRIHRHHIIPRVVWKRLKRRRKVKGRCPVVDLCGDCGRQVHVLFTENELAGMSWEELKEHPDVREYVEWVRKRKKKVGRMRRSKRIGRRK